LEGLTRFITDASLEDLARRLRFLGYDVDTHRGARLTELFAVAAAQGRVVLTLSARRPPGDAVEVVRVPRGDVAAAVRALATRYTPSGPRWSRCPRCNTALRSRSTFEAIGEVPARITRAGWPLAWCPSCGGWFWPGSHVVRMNAWFDRVLGPPPVAPPELEGSR
jgi:uncharacterized protein with PIN domain